MGRELKGITVAYALPGRVRLKIPEVKENPELARQAQEKLGRVPGIQRVEATPATHEHLSSGAEARERGWLPRGRLVDEGNRGRYPD